MPRVARAPADDRPHRMILTARPIPADCVCVVLGLVIRTCRDQTEGEVTVVSSSLSSAMEVAPGVVGSLASWPRRGEYAIGNPVHGSSRQGVYAPSLSLVMTPSFMAGSRMGQGFRCRCARTRTGRRRCRG